MPPELAPPTFAAPADSAAATAPSADVHPRSAAMRELTAAIAEEVPPRVDRIAAIVRGAPGERDAMMHEVQALCGNQIAGQVEAALAREPGPPPGPDAVIGGKPGIQFFDDRCELPMTTPVDAVLTAVGGAGGSRFDLRGVVPIERAAMRDIPAADLAHVSGVTLVGTPNQKSGLTWKAGAGGLELLLTGAVSLNSWNVTLVRVELASGKSFQLSMPATRFKTDVTQLRRAEVLQRIRGVEDTIDSYAGSKDEAAARLAHPPPPSPAAVRDDAELSEQLAHLDQLRARIAARSQALHAGFGQAPASRRAVFADHLADAGQPADAPANQLAGLGRKLAPLANQRVAAQREIDDNRPIVDALGATPGGPEPEILTTARSRLAAATARAAELDAQMRPLEDAIAAGLAADPAMFEQALERYDTFLIDVPAGEASYADLKRDVATTERLIAVIRIDLDNQRKLAEGTAAADRDTVRRGGDKLGELKARRAALEAELHAIQGPIYEMMDASARLVPPDAAAPVDGGGA